MPVHAPAMLCALAAGLVLLPSAAAAETPTPTPTPSPILTTAAPLPTPSGSPTLPVWNAALRFTPGPAAGTGTIRWVPAAGATGYTVEIVGHGRRTTTAPSTTVSGLAGSSEVRVTVVAINPAGALPAAAASWIVPADVPEVPAARLSRTATGLRLRWTAAPGASAYLVELRGADGMDLQRRVRGTGCAFGPLTAGTLYSASVTAVAPDGRRSAVRAVPAVLYVPAVASAPSAPAVAAPPTVPPSARTSAPVGAAVQASPPMRAAAIRPTLVDSPITAAACAIAAVVLGALAVLGLLLRRPRFR